MKLSKAIREGAKLRPQGFSNWFTFPNCEQICSCALGAAYEAIFQPKFKSFFDTKKIKTFELENRFPELTRLVKTPISGEIQWLQNAIGELNDKHKWTRNQIADWVESEGY
jgi:hypothetical protein